MRIGEEEQSCATTAKVNMSKLRKASALPLTCVNHISRVCANLTDSTNFYENVLGFVQIKRPGSFDFEGAWLFNYGIGIHLLESEMGGLVPKKAINPKDDHVSFQCEDMTLVEQKLQESGIEYLRREVEEAGILVDQLFFHDPDGFMIEVCNCDKLPVVPLARAASIKSQQQLFSSCKRTSSLSSQVALVIQDSSCNWTTSLSSQVAMAIQDSIAPMAGVTSMMNKMYVEEQVACPPAYGLV